MEIFLVRRGETEWNTQGRFQGQLDSALTANGRRQAEQVGQRLAAIVGSDRDIQLHVSPLGRTRETAEIFGQYRSYPLPVLDVRLQEITTGSWDGLTHPEIHAGWPGLLDGSTEFDCYFRSPDGEGYNAAIARIRKWLDDSSGRIIAVSHGLLGRLIRGTYLGLPQAQALCLPVPQDTVWHLHGSKVVTILA